MFDGSSSIGNEWRSGKNVAGVIANNAHENADKKLKCDRVHRRLKRIVKARAALDAQEIAMLREANQLRLWREYGCSSLIDYMERELGYSQRAAVERLRVASVMSEVPALELALTQGDISFSGAREIARVATPETIEQWIGATEGKNVREIEEMVSGHAKGDLPTDPPDPAIVLQVLRFEVKPATKARVREVEKLFGKVYGERLDQDAFMNALCAAAEQYARYALAPDEEPARERVAENDHADRADEQTGDQSNEAANDASAHVGQVTREETAGIVPACRDEARAPTDRARYQVAVTICEWCKRGWQDGGGLIAAMTEPEIDRALCDAQHIGSLAGEAIERARQEIPPATRRFVKRRDHGRCRVPGCRSTHNVDQHHIKPRWLGGSNDPENLVTLCEGHHLALHDGTLVIGGTHPEWTFTRRVMSSLGRESLIIDTKKALVKLGFRKEEVKEAIAKARAHVGEQAQTLEQWIKVALRYCPKPR